MTRLSNAELRQLCIDNPDFAARNAQAIRDALRRPESAVTTEGERVSLNKPVDAADTLLAHIRTLAPDLFVLFIREYPFDRWRVDLAVPSSLLAVEVNGGRWLPGGGKHGTERDRKKIRRLTLAGWRVLEYSTEIIANDPIGVIAEIRQALSQ